MRYTLVLVLLACVSVSCKTVNPISKRQFLAQDGISINAETMQLSRIREEPGETVDQAELLKQLDQEFLARTSPQRALWLNADKGLDQIRLQEDPDQCGRRQGYARFLAPDQVELQTQLASPHCRTLFQETQSQTILLDQKKLVKADANYQAMQCPGLDLKAKFSRGFDPTQLSDKILEACQSGDILSSSKIFTDIAIEEDQQGQLTQYQDYVLYYFAAENGGLCRHQKLAGGYGIENCIEAKLSLGELGSQRVKRKTILHFRRAFYGSTGELLEAEIELEDFLGWSGTATLTRDQAVLRFVMKREEAVVNHDLNTQPVYRLQSQDPKPSYRYFGILHRSAKMQSGLLKLKP